MSDDLSGEMIEKTHMLAIRVYYEDTDFSGRVYHANYLKFCERGRTDFLRVNNIHHQRLARLEKPLFFVVRHMDIDFLAGAKIDDILSVKTKLVLLKGVKFILHQSIECDGVLMFEAKVTCAIVNAAGKPSRIDKETQNILAKQLI